MGDHQDVITAPTTVCVCVWCVSGRVFKVECICNFKSLFQSVWFNQLLRGEVNMHVFFVKVLLRGQTFRVQLCVSGYIWIRQKLTIRLFWSHVLSGLSKLHCVCISVLTLCSIEVYSSQTAGDLTDLCLFSLYTSVCCAILTPIIAPRV